MCHPQFRPGPPSEQAQTASTFLRDAIANSKLVDCTDLSVKAGKLAWAVHLDVVCLNHDGNVVDASLKAAVAALRNLRLPAVTVTSDENDAVAEDVVSVDAESRSRSPLRMGALPVGCTVVEFAGRLLVDPTAEEEEVATSGVTVVVDSDSGEICQLLKTGVGRPMSRDKLQECTAIAKKQAKKIVKMIEAAAPAKI